MLRIPIGAGIKPPMEFDLPMNCVGGFIGPENEFVGTFVGMLAGIVKGSMRGRLLGSPMGLGCCVATRFGSADALGLFALGTANVAWRQIQSFASKLASSEPPRRLSFE